MVEPSADTAMVQNTFPGRTLVHDAPASTLMKTPPPPPALRTVSVPPFDVMNSDLMLPPATNTGRATHVPPPSALISSELKAAAARTCPDVDAATLSTAMLALTRVIVAPAFVLSQQPPAVPTRNVCPSPVIATDVKTWFTSAVTFAQVTPVFVL